LTFIFINRYRESKAIFHRDVMVGHANSIVFVIRGNDIF